MSSIPRAKPVQKELPKSYCIKCIQTDVEVQRLRQENKKLEEKLNAKMNIISNLQQENGRLKVFESKFTKTSEKCRICDGKFTMEEFQKHLCSKCDNEIGCEYCSKVFKTTIALIDHLDIFHDDKTFYDCDRCNRKFEMLKLLDMHTDTHPDEEPQFSCEKCDRRFYSRLRLDQHTIDEHPEPEQSRLNERKSYLK